jgi:8-oxo-dGTP pyrophosphatase MutT (NUDIX family)
MKLEQAYGGTASSLRVSATAFIRDEFGRVLLQQRSDNGFWNLPGGGLELGESVAEACVREVREETGLIVEIVRLIGVYSAPKITTMSYPDGRVIQYITSLFECRMTGGKLEVDAESLALEWFDPQKLPKPFSPNHIPRLQDALAGQTAAFWR